MNNTKKIALCGMMTALAMVFSYIEAIIPIPMPVPGIKLGLANMAVIVIMYTVGIKEAIAADVIRVVLTAAMFGNFNSFLFSISGAVLSLAVMALLKCTDRFSETGVSVAGGIFHNVGQITAAVFIMETAAIAYYLPVLMVSGIVTGAVIGTVAALIIKRLKRLKE